MHLYLFGFFITSRFHCPDVITVKRHMNNWAALQRSPRAQELIEAALNRWGRENLLDWPTKLGIIVQKTDERSLVYCVEALYTRMWRSGNKDPYVTSGLAEVIAEILWAKSYMASFLRLYPDVFNARCNSSDASTTVEECATQSIIRMAKCYLDSPGP